ncbi:MAG: DUF2012 domain-containing protein [Myxococcota bacterium]
MIKLFKSAVLGGALVCTRAVLGVALVCAACGKQEEAPAPAPEPQAAPVATPTPAPAAEPVGKGTVAGTVAFTGKAPVMPPLKRDTDPYCGKVKMTDEEVLVKDGKLQNVIVRVKGLAKEFPAPAEPAVINQDQCMYRPRVSGVVAGQTVLVKNGDQTMHNVHTYRGQTTLFNEAMPPIAGMTEKKHDFKAGEPDIIKWKCDVHPWMTGYLLVSAHPFFAVTGEDGAFTLKDVPAGKYTVEAWHEKYGAKTVEVTVEADKSADAKFEYTGS